MLSYVCLSARRDNVGGRSGQRWFTRLHHQTFIARTTELRAAEIRKAERGSSEAFTCHATPPLSLKHQPKASVVSGAACPFTVK